MRIIPAIDIINGRCVRLEKGDYGKQKTYHENPVEVAKMFEAEGMRYLHLVDLDGAKSKHIVHHKILREITSQTSLQVDFGGGIKTDSDIKIAFENGAAQITAGSIALQNPALFLSWLQMYGAEKIILGADAHNRKIASNGWQDASEMDILDFVRNYHKEGVQYVLCTDIAKDGMLQGAAENLYREILAEVPVKLIASGGVSSVQDIINLQAIGCEGVIIGKAIYERKIHLKDLRALC